MIRYNKKITVKETKYGYKLETDRGDIYELMPITSDSNQTPITTWWEKQNQTTLRRDQLDCIIKEYWRQHGPLDLFVVYKRGEGYSQPHDIVLARSPKTGVWILSTSSHTWFESSSNIVEFNIDNALGSVSNHDERLEIYSVIDGIHVL